MKILIKEEFVKEALEYAKLSKSFTSDTHDFHEGGLKAKQRKMFEGKLGEKGIKQFFIENNINFKEDESSHKDSDEYDFIIYFNNNEYLVDVKTRTQNFHTRTLEMVKQMNSKNINIYFSVKLEKVSTEYQIIILGWCYKEDFIKINRIQNQGYLDNYVLYDNELRHIETLKKNL